ncbi:MAG: hypothetical protein AB7P04_03300 [Bacteriovoracia bacterium]
MTWMLIIALILGPGSASAQAPPEKGTESAKACAVTPESARAIVQEVLDDAVLRFTLTPFFREHQCRLSDDFALDREITCLSKPVSLDLTKPFELKLDFAACLENDRGDLLDLVTVAERGRTFSQALTEVLVNGALSDSGKYEFKLADYDPQGARLDWSRFSTERAQERSDRFAEDALGVSGGGGFSISPVAGFKLRATHAGGGLGITEEDGMEESAGFQGAPGSFPLDARAKYTMTDIIRGWGARSGKSDSEGLGGVTPQLILSFEREHTTLDITLGKAMSLGDPYGGAKELGIQLAHRFENISSQMAGYVGSHQYFGKDDYINTLYAGLRYEAGGNCRFQAGLSVDLIRDGADRMPASDRELPVGIFIRFEKTF